MIRDRVDFARNNRVSVLAIAIPLLLWGVISFRQLPMGVYEET